MVGILVVHGDLLAALRVSAPLPSPPSFAVLKSRMARHSGTGLPGFTANAGP